MHTDAFHQLQAALVWPSRYEEAGKRLGLEWPRGVLVYGPPGVGKESLVSVSLLCDLAS